MNCIFIPKTPYFFSICAVFSVLWKINPQGFIYLFLKIIIMQSISTAQLSGAYKVMMETDEMCSNTAGVVCVCVLLTLHMFSHSCSVCAILLGKASVTQVIRLPPPSPPLPFSLPLIFMFFASVVSSSAEAGRQCGTVRERKKR